MSYDPFLTYGRGSPDQLEPQPFERYSAPRSDNFDEFYALARKGYSNPPIVDYPVNLRRSSQDSYGRQTGSPENHSAVDYEIESNRRGTVGYHSRRRPLSQDEFDGPSQYLPLPLPQQDSERAQGLIELQSHLDIHEQDELLSRTNDILSECAFHFVAKYQFPIPLERDKPRVRAPADREWTEWAYLLKRLATKRRIPARVLFDNQIRQLVTTLENSIVARENPRKQRTDFKRKSKDDRYVLQLISAGIQVARILMDSLALQQLDELYERTEAVILERRRTRIPTRVT